MAKKKNTQKTTSNSWSPIDQLVSAYDELRKQNGGKRVSNDQLNNAYIQKSFANASSADFIAKARRGTAEAQQATNTIAKTGYNRNYQAGAEDYTNAITGQYKDARNDAIAKLRKASTSTGITAAGDIGAAATAMQKKATGRAGMSATGKSSLKAEIEDQSSKSKIPWTQPITASNVKYRDSATKMAEDNAKWANRAMLSAEKAMQKAADKKDVEAYRKAVAQYQKAAAAYANSESKVMQRENAMQEQSNYVRRHASEEQGDALKSERSNMLSDASMGKDTSTIYSEEDQQRFQRAGRDTDSRAQRLQELSQTNDYYADPAYKVYEMSEKELQDAYSEYKALKGRAQTYDDLADEYRRKADQALNDKQSSSNVATYQKYMDTSKSYREKARSTTAELSTLIGGNSKYAYALETTAEMYLMAKVAANDKNFKKYAELGAKSDWKPKLQNSFESMLNQIGYTNSSDALLNAMTKEQRDTLHYYLGRGDEDSAQKYFSALEPTLASARMSKARDEMSDFTEAHPVFGTAANAFASTASVPLRAVSVVDNAVKAVQNDINPYYDYQPYATNTLLDAPAVMNQGVQLGLGQKLQDTFGMNESGANFLAGTIVSMANNAMQFGAAGGGAKLSFASLRSAVAQKGGSEAAKVAAQQAVEQAASEINQWLPLALMSTNAGVDTIREQLESGKDFGQAFLYGALCGGVEAWTEKIGVDSWVELATKGVETGLLKGVWNASGKIDRAKLQNLVKTAVGLGNQALSEGGEEVISNVVDTILDVAINGEDSEFMQYRDNLIAQGYSAQEAERKATIQFYVKNSGESFAGGALSGFVFGAFNIPANLQSDMYIGQSIIDNGTDLDLVNAGLEYGTDTEVYRLASQIANKLDNKDGYQTTAKEITRLSVAMSNASKNTAAASMTEQQVQDGGSSQLSTFASELKATGAISGREAIAANTVMAKALDGEPLTAADIKALHADIPAVREVLSRKLGTIIETGSADEVRTAIANYIKDGNSAKTQADGQLKARDIIKDAIPYAKKAAMEDVGAEVAGVRQGAEAQAQSAVDTENAAFDSAVADQAASAASRISAAADQQVSEQKAQSSRDKRGNLNYKVFSEEYRASHPQAGNSEITKAYDKANREFKSKDTINVDGREFTRDEFKGLVRVRGVNASNAGVEQMFAASIASEQDTGEKPHYSLSTLEDQLEGKTVSTETTETASTKAEAETQTETAETADADKTENSNKLTEAEAQEAYAGKSLTESEEIYSYYFMKNLPDMNVVELPSASALRNEKGTINKANIVSEGMKNARSVGTERDGNAYVVTVKNRYTGRDIQVTSNAIRHGLNGAYARMATNAQLGSRVGTLIQNAVPVNALDNTAKSGNVTGTYAMAALTTDSEGRQVVAVITVEQRSNTVTGIESYDVAHALNGRKTGSPKAAGGSQADARSQVLNLIKTAKISVADFMDVVKDTHRSILSEDVLHHLNLERPIDGYYTGRARYSTNASENESGKPNVKTESSKSKSDTLDTGKDTMAADTVENSPAPSGKYDENHPNRIAQWLVKEAQSALTAMGVQNAEISVDYSMDKNSNGYYVVKDGKRRIVLNGQLGGTTRNGQLYSAQQNIRFVLAHEIGHIAQGVGYTGETNLYTDQIIQMYEDVTGITPNEVESSVREIMIQYMDEADRDGSSLGISRNDVTMDYAKGEYAANCLAEMLGNYNTLREIAKSQNRNLIQRAINKLERFQSKLITDRRRKNRIKQDIAAQERGDADSSAASNVTDWVAVAGLYDEAAEDIRSMLKKAMDNSRYAQVMNESGDGDTRTSVHAELGRSIDKYITPDSIKRQIEQVVEMKPVAELSGNEFQKNPNKSLDKMMHEFFNELGNSVETKTLGRVILDDAGIGSDMGHGVFSRKSAAIAAIPDVLGKGEIIDYQSNWKDRPYETICIAAPVTLRGKLYYEGVIVRRLNYGDSFYTHDVLLAEAAEKAKDGALPQKTGSSEERVIARSKTPSIASLLLKVSEVKYQNEKSQNDSPARYSLNTNETDLPGLDEDNTSKFSRFEDAYEEGTKLVGKAKSIQAAADLKREYGSKANTQSIATKYRQMSTVAEQLENVYLDGMMGEEIIGQNNRNSVYEEAQRQLMELGREVADEIIDGATVKEQGDSTVYEYLKDRLRGEKIYVPDKIKQNVAETLQCDTWGEARRKYFGVLSNTVNDASKGIEIDSLYNAIQEEFPGAIRGEVLSRADQLSAIIDAYNSARDSQSVEYNPLARNITERSDNRERIAQDVVSRMEALVREHAMDQYNEYSAAKKSEAARLERQAAYQERQAKAEQSEGKSGEAAQKRADALKEQAAEAKLMSQTDEETILESVHAEGLGGEAAEQRLEQSILSPEVLEWAKHSKELDRVVARMLAMQKRNKQMVSQVRSNTFAGSDFFTEAELALDGMRPGDFTYKVKPEAESFGEAASRLIGKVKDKLQSQNDQEARKVTLDRGEYEHQKQDLKEAAGRLDDNYLHWYETLQSKDHWTGVDLDTAMMILNQIRTNDRAIGDYRESSKWAKIIQERGTEGGQFIQSFAKWSRTTDGMIARATQELDDKHLGREVNGKAIQRLNEENQQTSEQITIETQKNDALRRENDELLKEREHLREELKKAQEINRNAGKENDKLYDKIYDKILRITKEIQEKDGENIRLQDIVDVLDGKVRDRLAKVSQLGTENTQIVAEHDRLTAQYEGLEQQNSQLETMIAAGQKEVEMLKAAIDAMKQKNGAQEISLTELTQELQDVLDGLKADCEDAVQQKGILQKILQGLSRTKDPAKIRELVTKTTNQKLNDRWGRLMGDLLDNVASGKKTRIINDMTRIADMINAAESWQLAANAGDKTAELKMRNQLIDCIMDAAKTRGMKPSRKVEEWMRKNFSAQDTAYLNKFARTSLANIADDYQGSSAGQKLSTWQYLAQLLNFRTAARNVVSNAAFQGIDTVARNGGVWIDVLLSKKTGNRTVGYSARHGSDTSAWAGAKDRAGRAMLEVMLDVDTESGNARSKYGESARRTYKMAQQGISGALSRTMSRLEMINGISLNVTDEFFKGAIYQGTINANAKLVAEGLMTMEESIQFATEDMLYRTFQDDTLVGSLLNGFHDTFNRIGIGSEHAKANGTYKKHGLYVHDFGLGDIVCKYRGVPGALVTRAVEFSPMGYLKALYNAHELIKSGGTDTHAQRNFALGLSRASTGSGLIALFAWLCANGLLKREEDEDDKNVAALDRAGGLGGTQLNLSAIKRLILGEENATEWQNGDELTDIGFLDPLSSTMTIGAMIAKSMKEDGSPFLAALAGAQGGMTAAAFSDLSMMDTINDLVYTIVYHDEQSDLPILADVGATLATSAITGFEPSLLRQAAQASDNHYRDVYGGGAVEDWINKNIPGKSDTAAAIQKGLNSIAVNLPGLRQTVPTKLDPMGNEKVYSPSGSVGRNIANAFFNPGKNSVYTVGSVSEEMGRVRRLTGETGFYPDRNAPNSISFGSDYGNEKVKLTDAQKRRYVLDAGNMFESLAEETMKTDAYKNATNDEKAELLQDVKSYAAYKAKQQLYENLHARDKGYTPYVNDDWSKTEAGMDAGIKFGEMRRILSDTSERKMPSDYDENGDTISGSREGKILDYINDLGYKDDQKLNLYGIIRGSGSESSVEKMQNVMDAGLSFYEASKVRKEFNAINDKPYTINDSDMNNHDYFNKWLNDEGYSESEIETINENYKFYTQIRQESDSILKRLTENGMDYDSAYEIANKVAAIEPEDDEDEVAISQKYDVILDDYNMSTGEKQAAIAAIAGTKSVFGDLDEGAAQTMMDLFSQTGQTSAISANAGTSYTVDGTKYDYTEDQQEAYNQAYIWILNNISGASVSSVKTMEDIRDIAANAGKYAALEQAGLNPDLDSSDYGAYRKAQQAMNTGLDLATYCEIKSTCNSFSADKDSNGKSISGSKKKKVVAYLRSQGLSTQQYNFFYSTIMGYK